MLFCLTAEYKAETLHKLRSSEETRDVAIQKFMEAAGCKLVAFYSTIKRGPGALMIVDAPDGITAAAIMGTAKAADHVENLEIQRLYTMDEVRQIRAKSKEMAKHFQTP